MRYFIEFSYKGTAYHGWQKQPNAISVQEKLQEALSLLLRQTIEVVGAGRTDAGVHASQMYAHFDLELDFDLEKITFRLNKLLPHDISVLRLFHVNHDAHARFHASSRSYEYHIYRGKSPFLKDLAWQHQLIGLDISLMNEAAAILLTYKDFQCFSRSKTDVKTYICDITKAYWEENDSNLVFKISADRFLRNMVRAIVGTLIEIGMGKLSISDFHQIIESKNRSNAGVSAPSEGLFLTKVIYPETIQKT